MKKEDGGELYINVGGKWGNVLPCFCRIKHDSVNVWTRESFIWQKKFFFDWRIAEAVDARQYANAL
jgi:hypothetical protein